MRKKVLTIALAVAMTFTVSTSVFADPISDQQQIINQNQDLINKSKQNEADITDNIEVLDDQIAQTNTQIDDNKLKIANTQKQIKQAELDMKAAEDKMADEQDLFDQRMRAIYIHGSNGVSGYLSIILESKGMNDFISRVETVKKLVALDNKILSDLEKQKADVQMKKDTLDTENAKLLALYADNQQKLTNLNNDKQQQISLIQQEQQQQSKYSAQIKAAQAAIKALYDAAPPSNPNRGTVIASSNAIVVYAQNFLGRPYKYGANGPDSFDCSGFTKFVFAHFGISLNRVAAAQATQGVTVPKNQLQPGDLVFFGYSMAGIHHVGIYVGGGCYIHAPHTGDVVRISSLDERGSDFYIAKRVY